MTRVWPAVRAGILVFWALVCLFPLYWIAICAFKQPAAVADGPSYLPSVDFKPTLSAWRYILFDSSDDTLRRFVNSVVVACGTTALTLLVGGLAAFAFVRWRGAPVVRDRLLLATLATRILPPVVMTIPIYLIVEYAGALDTWGALIAAYTATNLPIGVWILRDAFAAVPSDFADAAELDGASALRIFFGIMVPLARAEIAATALLVSILAWNEYTFAVYLTSDHALTMPPFLAGQMAVREQMATAEPQWDYFAVLIVLMVAPLLCGAVVLQRVVAGAFVNRASP
jgi:multiple sugar transport system permease protein